MTKAKLKELRDRMILAQLQASVVNETAVVVLTARELEELLDTVEKKERR